MPLSKFLAYLLIILTCFLSCSKNSTDPDDPLHILPYGPAQWYNRPSWSPDGERITFTFYKTIPESICVVKPDGSGFDPLIPGRGGTFSPDGQKMTFQLGNDIYIINFVTDEINRLTTEGSNYYPRWSPDGKRIAYDSNYNSPNGGNVVWLMNPDGNNKKDISIHEVGEWKHPYWIPDFRIVFTWAIEGCHIFIMDSTGLNAERLTSDFENRFPSVPNDGTKIVWERWLPEIHEVSIWIMNIDGTGKKKLTTGLKPCISPDGTKVAFVREGFFDPVEGWDEEDPKIRGSLWTIDISTLTESKVLGY